MTECLDAAAGTVSQQLGFAEAAREVEKTLKKISLWRPAAAEAEYGIPYEKYLPSIARELVSATMLSKPHQPMRASFQRLRALACEAGELVKDGGLMAQLSVETRSSLIKMAHVNVPQPSRTAAGAPRKEIAANVADLLASHFFALTGKEPSGSDDGLFASHLGEIYVALGVAINNPAYQAKQAAANLKKIRSKSTRFPS